MARELTSAAWLKRALLLIIIGLIVQMFALVHITPASFLLFAAVGVGPVALGLMVFVYAVIQHRRQPSSSNSASSSSASSSSASSSSASSNSASSNSASSSSASSRSASSSSAPPAASEPEVEHAP